MYGVQVSAFTIKDGVWSETVMAKTQLGRKFNLRNNVLFSEKTKQNKARMNGNINLKKHRHTHTGRKMQKTKYIHCPTRFERITSQRLWWCSIH